jgi:hypothetical protein
MPRGVHVQGSAEDLEDADLAALLLGVIALETAHPQGCHRARRETHAGPDLDPALGDQPALESGVFLSYDLTGAEPLLSARTAP